ncbi:type VI secretion system baseplate subunit TssE [Paraburkholderia sp.]|jgi:type VI secretion system protein ImpF|uniref:type VI secretion system baseplate subunit TssE n=1 Tax=Paraburkholderia sp. TaxID=1926495 RepID=UPI002AFF4116|nr:type VI secretion system baseplate subunit TssE [Paraburkholderia sp.]
MPRRANTHLLPTLLDRLRDDAPQQLTECPEDHAPTRAQMRDIVQRDLMFLLNTISMENDLDRGRYPHAASSTINYGIPPLAGAYLVSRKWSDIEEMIQRAVREFEPRLIPDSLAVKPLAGEDAANPYNVLMFEIRGMIHMDPYPLEFLVQSSIDLETSRMNIANVRVS